MPAVLEEVDTLIGSGPDSEENVTLAFSSLTCSTQPKLKVRHFISRGGGVLVPMIPLDELPVTLQGVPARLTWPDTEDMVFMGEHQSSGTRYSLIDGDVTPMSNTHEVVKRHGRGFGPGAEEVRLPVNGEVFQQEWKIACAQAEFDEKPDVDHDEDLQELAKSFQEAQKHEPQFPISIPSTPRPQAARIMPRQDAVSPSPLELHRPFSFGSSITNPKPLPTSGKPLPPSGIEPDETLKEYCSYWVRTGECAFAQQGCKYKHIMPMDRATLKKIYGTDHWPKWWVERQRDEDIKAGRIPAFPRTLPVKPARSSRQDIPRRPVNPGSALAAAASIAVRSPQPHLLNGHSSARRHERHMLATAPGLGQVKSSNSRALAADLRRPLSRASTASINRILRDPFSSLPVNAQQLPYDEDDLIELESVAGSVTSSKAKSSGLGESKWATAQPDFPRLFVNSPAPQVAKAASTTDTAPRSSRTSSTSSSDDEDSESSDEEGEVTEASKANNQSSKKNKHKRRARGDKVWYKVRREKRKARNAAAQQDDGKVKDGKAGVQSAAVKAGKPAKKDTALEAKKSGDKDATGSQDRGASPKGKEKAVVAVKDKKVAASL